MPKQGYEGGTLTILGEVSLLNVAVLGGTDAKDEEAWLVDVGPPAT